MVIGSGVKRKIGEIIQVQGPYGRASGLIPALVLKEASKEMYLEEMKDYPDHIPDENTLNSAYFYLVSVD